MREALLALAALVACAPPASAPVPASVGVAWPAAAAAASQPAAPDPNLIRPCPKGAARHAAEVAALAASPCFELAAADGDQPLAWPSALSLRTWWGSGGDTWLERYLTIADAELNTARRIVGTSPTPRAVLTAESAPAHPLRSILCPAAAVDDGSCGKETAGWALRANRALEEQPSRPIPGAWCAERTHDRPAEGSSYAVFRSCLNDVAERRDALPLGAFRAPTEGWLLVAHFVFIAHAGCDEDLAAFDLATGAAFVYRCNPRDTPPARLTAGRVSVGALREAAWMTMLEGVTETDIRPNVDWFEVPADVPIERRRGETIRSRRVVISRTDAPFVAWSWMRPRSGTLAGQASGHYEPARAGARGHATALLEAAEASLDRTCAPALPPQIAIARSGDVGPPVREHAEPVGPLFQRLATAEAAIASAKPRVAGCARLP